MKVNVKDQLEKKIEEYLDSKPGINIIKLNRHVEDKYTHYISK